MLRPARKKPPTVDRLVRTIACKKGTFYKIHTLYSDINRVIIKKEKKTPLKLKVVL